MFLNKITEQLKGNTTNNFEIENFKVQLIKNAEQVFMLD